MQRFSVLFPIGFVIGFVGSQIVVRYLISTH
jgi:hypothetical protein